MKRSMMQVYVKGSVEAVHTYQKAFDAEILELYPDGKGGYAHSELKIYGQVLAVSEQTKESVSGNSMQFCLHFGEGGEAYVQKAYAVLKEDAVIDNPIGPCDYSPCMFSLVDKYGVFWCLFV